MATSDIADDQPSLRRIIFLNTEQAAASLQTSERTLRRMRDQGRGPRYFKFDERYLYRDVDIETFVLTLPSGPEPRGGLSVVPEPQDVGPHSEQPLNQPRPRKSRLRLES